MERITSPGWMHETRAQGWCTGKTLRDGMGWGGRWEWGSGWGTHAHPRLIHVNVWQKPLQYYKVISLQLKKIKKEKKLPGNTGDLRDAGSIPRSGRSPEGRHGNPVQYSCLENAMVRGAWQAKSHGVAKSWTQLK